MKRNIIIPAALAAMILLLPACSQETEIEGVGTGNKDANTIAFALGSNATRSSAAISEGELQGATIPVGTDNDGNMFYLKESIADLDAPETRGTPAYTENVVKLYNGQFASHSPQWGNQVFKYDGSKYYCKSYGQDPWSTPGADPLYFFMWMPNSPTNVTNMGWTGTTSQQISFDYTSPATAADQQDIVFSARSIGKSEYQQKGYADLLFHHALTGVKFATSNHISTSEEGTKTYITKVVFRNLVDGGHCVVTPEPENGVYIDDPTQVFSSSKDGVVVWSSPSRTNNTQNGIYQTFTPDNYAKDIYENSDYTFPASFKAKDATWPGEDEHLTSDWNINDKNATLTFWLIPQTLNENVTLDVTFYIQAGQRKGEEITRTINFGEILNGVEWKAGQLRTYVLEATEVDVEITDEINEGVKENVQITNLGNVPEYVRATVIAYWADENGDAVFGFESETSNNYVQPWQLEVEAGNSPLYGTMEDFYPGNPAHEGEWTVGNDGYYYYTGGEQNGVIGVDEAHTKVLFKSYTLDPEKIPEIWQIDQKTLQRTQAQGVHLVMELVCQAILAKDDVTWNNAWKETLGYDPSAN